VLDDFPLQVFYAVFGRLSFYCRLFLFGVAFMDLHGGATHSLRVPLPCLILLVDRVPCDTLFRFAPPKCESDLPFGATKAGDESSCLSVVSHPMCCFFEEGVDFLPARSPFVLSKNSRFLPPPRLVPTPLFSCRCTPERGCLLRAIGFAWPV